VDIQHDVDLKNYCTFRIGGKAKYFAVPKTVEDLKEALHYAKNKHLKITFFGGGSNILFPDTGLQGLLIRNNLKGISQEKTNNSEQIIIKVMSGENWLAVHKFCQQYKLYGLEAFSGLPGTIGGAIYGNAGAHGLEIKDVLYKVECINLSTNEIITLESTKLVLDYRTSILKQQKHLIVLAAYFKVSTDFVKQTGDPQAFAKFRKEKQPQGLTTGSFFKNPPNDYAGRLIDEAGLKGYRIGDIMISEKHANFFLNLGEAKSEDVIALKNMVQEVVKEKFQVNLETEVQIITENL